MVKEKKRHHHGMKASHHHKKHAHHDMEEHSHHSARHPHHSKMSHHSKHYRHHEMGDGYHDRYIDERHGGIVNKKPQKYNDEYHRDKDHGGDMDFNPRIAVRANTNEFYAGMPARRRQEIEDAGMIHEDDRAIANLPQYIKIEAYPKPGYYLEEGLDDTIAGIDRQIGFDDAQRDRHFYPKKV